MDYFNDAFVVFPLRKFSYSLKKIEQSLAKIYVIDNGLIENLIGDDKAKKFENSVFLSFLQKELEPNKNLFYHAFNGGEIDFIIKKQRKVSQLIQACFNLTDFNVRERELKSLVRGSQELNCNNLLLITWDEEKEEKIKGKTIKFVPLWKWLLT